MASKRKTRIGEVSTDTSNKDECYVSLDRNLPLNANSKKSKMSKNLEKDGEASERENSGSESEGSMNKEKEHKHAKNEEGAKKRKMAEKDIEESGNETSDSESSVPEEKKKRLDKKKIDGKKIIKKDSEVSGSENSESESEKSKNKEKKHKRAKNGKGAKKSKMAKNAEKDSEESGDDTSDSESSVSKEKIDGKYRKIRLIACKICKKEFKLYAALVRHQKVHNVLNYPCVLCTEKFESLPAYSNHMNREHPHVNAFPCVYPKCEESFKTQKKRRDHEKSHLIYMCRFCKKGFKRKLEMHMHVREVHY